MEKNSLKTMQAGMPAVLPPPEEKRDVKTATEAARAKKQRSSKAKVQKA
jgi:hypothetical protein